MDFTSAPDTDFTAVGDLGKKEAAAEIRALREGVNYHDYLYYVKDAPEISDAVYDKLFHRLQELEEAFPDLQDDDSPTRRIGAEPVSKLKKVSHRVPLLSLQAQLDAEKVRTFIKSVQKAAESKSPAFVLEPKFDGLSVEVIYRQGKFERGSTRGNGEVGEDISHNLKTIRTLPLTLQEAGHIPAFLAVRGEVYMDRNGFTALNRERVENGEEPFANPRNAAAGLMRQYESRRAAGKPLRVYFYEILATDGEWPDTHRQVLEQLTAWGLITSPLNKSAGSFQEIEAYHKRLAGKRDDLDFEIDGIVIKVDKIKLRESLGNRDRSPRWALAWKFEPRQEATLVEDIVVQVGRTGILTPVALLQPVDVGGVTVSRATLHNENEMRRKDIRVGDCVHVIRAGDVIPEIEERIKRPGKKRQPPFEMPERCPSCGSPVIREGAYWLCPAGLSCPAQLRGRIQHYAGRDAMDIDHLGEKAAGQLVERGLVHDLADLYAVGVDDLQSLEGFAERSARQLHEAIQGAKEARLDRFLYALGIPLVGRRVARQLAEKFGELEKVSSANRDAIEAVSGLGSEIAAATTDFFEDKRNRKTLKRMQAAGLKIKPMPGRGKQPLAGKTFVFSGGLDSLTRDEAHEKVESLGGRATSSVSSETDYLVVGDSPGSKLDEARDLGVSCIDEQEFLDMLNDN
ncbi:NAD-dependent DNA ligase LigA [Microbulbifer yueqingensis]|uniref:DNA ligase n=1 Tax=Microbulbifer yueqingensis TaxID=658219 RepID=A0A1G9AV74_9GAMM|nr:NAD-dependent DNA ligase LigA [Microbulbifer yueqingensis]SDK30580.1 DNA ligase (NAD+) [Microbulbifer yueqingensis]